MATFSKSLRLFTPATEYVCSRCLQFSTTSAAQSGHSRWSKIKHDKAVVDGKKNVKRSILSKEIALCSKLYGPDPTSNFKLGAILVNAKKAGLPKDTIEKAIARGQGKSASGAVLENITFEVMTASSIAMIVEAETDSKARTQMDIRHLIKKQGGNVTPVIYLFQKKGRISFEPDERNLGVDEVLDDAIEAGAEDVKTDEDGNIVIWTEANMTTSAAEALEKSLGLKVATSDVIWDANEDTMATLPDQQAAKAFADFLEILRENSEVQGVYANVVQGDLADDAWDRIQDCLDA